MDKFLQGPMPIQNRPHFGTGHVRLRTFTKEEQKIYRENRRRWLEGWHIRHRQFSAIADASR